MPGAKAVDPAGVVSDSPEVMVSARCSRLDEIAAEARGIMRSSIRDLGALLREAKELLPHGKFAGWARREAEWHARLAQKQPRRRVTHLPPPAPEPAVAPAHAESDRPAELAKLAARLFECGLAQDVREVLSSAERRTALVALLTEHDQ